MSKLRILWLCHFTNSEMQNHLPLWKRIDEFASWVPNTLKGFENRNDVEVHVISPHEYLHRDSKIIIRNIHYYFISYGIPFYHRHWPSFFKFDTFTNFWFLRRVIKKIINKIDPDVLNLIGAENAYYSSVALDLYTKYPTLVTIQGFICEFKNVLKKSFILRKRIKVEEQILTKLRYFSGDPDIPCYLSKYNKFFQFFPLELPVNEDLAANTIVTDKKFDCIFFGRLTESKGVMDFINVIAELKKRKPDIKSCIIGGGGSSLFKKLSIELNCNENIEFVGFVPTQKELFEYVKASKVFLAPTLIDRLSSTIREAMLLKIPIVSYATGAIPLINNKDKIIFLVGTGDYKGMAKETFILLQDEELRNRQAEKAYQFYMDNFSLKINIQLFLTAYHSIK